MSKTDNENKSKKIIVSLYEWIETFCTALFTVVVIFTFVCRFVTVDGSSMNNTFQHGDRLIISDLFYTPKCGDVVVVHDADEKHFEGPVIKRVIATAGETIDIEPETWTVTVTDVNGNIRTLDEPYVNFIEGSSMYVPVTEGYYTNALLLSEYPHTVKEGCVFVMGDNRNASLDSRLVGDIDERKILGKAYVRVFPNPSIDFN